MGKAGIDYSEVFTVSGVKIPNVAEVITPKIEKTMRSGRYEAGEVENLRRLMLPGDRVLELGAGIGLLSTVAAQFEGVESVTCIEANPEMVPIIAETHRINGVGNVDLRNAVVTGDDAPGKVPFYFRGSFWASSMSPEGLPYTRVEELDTVPLSALIEELHPTIIACDIEGGEMGLFDGVDLSGVRTIVLETHPKVYGEEGRRALLRGLARKGFHVDAADKPSSVVVLGRAQPDEPVVEPGFLPDRKAAPWPIADPRILVATCMKNEGPFVLEWLAWHKAAGVTDFIVFTNDCTDGTDALLDRLQALGHLRHLPNPALGTGSARFQPIALEYVHYLPEFREADFFISMDVDEFINVRVGEGRLADLFEATGEFDVLSLSEINHGANGRMEYERGWVTELFPGHEMERPGKGRARRGVKSIVRLSPRIEKVRNHRPDVFRDQGPVVWLNGSGGPADSLLEDATENGMDVRGSYRLASLDHFPLRSLESFLVKKARGDVVVRDKSVSHSYWRRRNRSAKQTSDLTAFAPQARKVWKALMKDKQVAELHEACCAAHERQIAALRNRPDIVELREWILANAWED